MTRAVRNRGFVDLVNDLIESAVLLVRFQAHLQGLLHVF